MKLEFKNAKEVIKRMEDLVNAGFEWMFSCPGFNVEEVE